MSRNDVVRLSDAEWTVMNIVWRRTPATARDVLDEAEAETGWAYTTVKTILARLVDKGVLRMGRRANTSLYEPAITRDQARREAVQSLLEKAFDGACGSLLQHLVVKERMSKRDRKELARMLGELDAGKKTQR